MDFKSLSDGALSGFLESGAPDIGPAGSIDDIGRLLVSSGKDGVNLAEALTKTPLDRAQFLLMLSRAVTSGIVEVNGENIRLTKAGASIY